MSLLCVDKRNGRVVYKEECARFTSVCSTSPATPRRRPSTWSCSASVSPAEVHRQALAAAGGSRGQPADTPQGRSAAGDLWNSMQKTFGRLIDEAVRKLPQGEEKSSLRRFPAHEARADELRREAIG